MRFTLLAGQLDPVSIVPRSVGSASDVYGRATIEVVGLNRRVLVERRNIKLLEIALRIRMLRKLISMALRAAPHVLPEDVKSLRYGKGNQQFATAAAACIQQELAGMRAELAALRQ